MTPEQRAQHNLVGHWLAQALQAQPAMQWRRSRHSDSIECTRVRDTTIGALGFEAVVLRIRAHDGEGTATVETVRDGRWVIEDVRRVPTVGEAATLLAAWPWEDEEDVIDKHY